MENKLGVVKDIKILSANRALRQSSGACITFVTNENVMKDQYVDVPTGLGTKHYQITDIEINQERLFEVKAKEVGYWARKIENLEGVDIRTMLDLEVVLVTDKEKISKIYTESCWC